MPSVYVFQYSLYMHGSLVGFALLEDKLLMNINTKATLIGYQVGIL